MKTSSMQDVRDMYNTNAEGYAQMMDKEIDLPIYKDILGRLHNLIKDTPGPLLDTACGSGHMLAMFHKDFDATRALIGADLSPKMASITQTRLGEACTTYTCDMRELFNVDTDSVAAVLNFYAIHHVDRDGVRQCLTEWRRVLKPGGHLLLAAWEGTGAIDYGEHSDVLAARYTIDDLRTLTDHTDFIIHRCDIQPVDGFPMDAVYLECQKPNTP